MTQEKAAGDTFNLFDTDNLKKLSNVEIKFVVEVGSAMLTVKDLLRLKVGSVIELDTLAGEHFNVRANGTLVLKGEVVMVGSSLGVRIVDVVSSEARKDDAC